MSFDGLVMSAVRHELQQKLTGGRIEKIYQPLPHEIVLLIHKERTKYRLLASADARDARVHLTVTTRENPLTPPLFCMVLRKHLEGGKIIDIAQSSLERVLNIRVEAIDELGMLSEKHLLCEIMGKHSNIILVDPSSNIILDGIIRFSYATSRHREVLPGRRYTPPPESGKLDPLVITEDDFRQAMWDPEQEIAVEKLLLTKFEGLSPQTCREIAIRAGLQPETSNQSLGELELQRLWENFRRVRECANTGSFKPTICYMDNKPLAFSAIELAQFPQAACRHGQMNAILDEFFSVRAKQQQLRQSASELIKVVRQELKKCRHKIAIHEETLRKAEDAEKLRITGELITANIYQIPSRAETVELVNYYDPEAKPVRVELNPHLSPAENAQAYFKKYTKARNSYAISADYLQQGQTELAYLESVLVALELADQADSLAEIKSELIKEGYLKPTISKGTKKPAPAAEPVPMSFRSGDGYEIMVGRNNRENDYLTLKMAKPEDMWLHVKDIPGSHVIIRNPSAAEIPAATMQQAAETAAYYSKARQSSKVPVDHTLRKYVRKPKGAKPGMVIYDNQKTVYVEPGIL